MCIDYDDCVDLSDLDYCPVCGYDADCPDCIGDAMDADFDDLVDDDDDADCIDFDE